MARILHLDTDSLSYIRSAHKECAEELISTQLHLLCDSV